MSDFSWPHEQKHAKLPCPSLRLRVYSNSCSLSWWCHTTISSSVIPLLLLPSIFPRMRVFSNESVISIRRPKYWSFRFSISHSSEYLELISMVHLLKNPLAIQKTWVQSLGWEDPLEKRKTTHSSILAWRIPWLYSPCGRKESESTEWLALLLSISFRIDWSDFLAVQGTLKSFL